MEFRASTLVFISSKMPYPHRVVNIPTGFKDLLEGVSKAVVKYQPESIPAFAAVFFNALLVFRDGRLRCA